eukprot:scaffold370_cov176-Amphora_coffeaeformis.AAC.11
MDADELAEILGVKVLLHWLSRSLMAASTKSRCFSSVLCDLGGELLAPDKTNGRAVSSGRGRPQGQGGINGMSQRRPFRCGTEQMHSLSRNNKPATGPVSGV